MPDTIQLLTNIFHYQKALDRYPHSQNGTKALHSIYKLFNMPITVAHLEETGIGRSVNSLRKLQGEVGDAARALVAKWKQMVSARDECDEPENNDSEPDNSCQMQESKKEIENNSSHRHSDKYKHYERQEKHDRDNSHIPDKKSKYDEYKPQSTSESNHSTTSSGKGKESEASNSYHSDDDDDPESGVASESEYSSFSEKVGSETSSKSNLYERDSKYDRKFAGLKESSAEKSTKYKRESDKDRKRQSSSDSKGNSRRLESQLERDHKKRKLQNDNSSDSNEQPPKRNSTTSDRSRSKRKHSESEEETKKIYKKSSQDSHRSSGSSHRSKENSSSSHRKENKSELDNHTSSRETHKSSNYKNAESNRDHKKEKSSGSDRKESKKSSDTDSKSERRKHDSKEDHSKSYEKSKKESSSKSDRKSDNKDKSKSKHSSKSSGSNGTSSSGSASKKKMVDIGSESGTSFAEALGMLEPTTSHKGSKKSKQPEPSHKPDKVEKNVKENKERVPVEKPIKNEKIDILIPPPPKADLDINIASLLPTITPNYRPVANPFIDSCNSRNRVMNDDEALSLVMTQKNQRTKVYSGNKCLFGTVPTLHELCIRILQDNIDALEYTGGVPYSILKPVIDKATADQLFILEHHNPYLIEDTDDIWHFHCQKEFRNKKRQEMESWRDMYMRCLDEREAKLRALTENIKVAQEKSTPVRQTKLAYMDSVVKPPRDVLRKQAKNSIDKRPIVTPSSRLNSIVASGGTATQVSVPNPAKASSSSGSSSVAMKPKKAPLMQKTLAFLKGNRFRR